MTTLIAPQFERIYANGWPLGGNVERLITLVDPLGPDPRASTPYWRDVRRIALSLAVQCPAGPASNPLELLARLSSPALLELWDGHETQLRWIRADAACTPREQVVTHVHAEFALFFQDELDINRSFIARNERNQLP